MPEPYMTAHEDLTMVIAQMTSGMKDCIPEQDDYELAREVKEKIEDMIQDYYH